MPSPKDFNMSFTHAPEWNMSSAHIELDTIMSAALMSIPGSMMKVEVTAYDEKKEKEARRTEQQNKYYHKLLDIICDYTGDTHRELHENLKFQFLAYPYVRGDKEYWIVKSTKDLTSKNFGDYLEKVFNWAVTEHDLVLPSSSDYYS